MALMESFITFSVTGQPYHFVLWKQNRNSTLHIMFSIIVDSPDNVTIYESLI